MPPGEQEPSAERADPHERRESRPDQPPPADDLPGDDDVTTGATALPGEVTPDASGIST